VDALARALLLNPDQHRHLRELAGLAVPARDAPGPDMLPRLRRMVDALHPNLAVVYDVHLDYLAWNEAYLRVRHDPARLPADRRNLVWMMFTDADNRARMVRWEPAARAVLSQFRAAAGQHPADPRFAQLIAALTDASPQFRAWWAEYPVTSFRPATIGIDHPEIGRVALELYQLRLVEHDDLLLVMQVPAAERDRRAVASLLETAAPR
jgi:hypothetical protein